MFGNSWRIARVGGVDIRVDASWAIIVILIGFLLFGRFDVMYASASRLELLLLTAVTTLLFFLSVVLHELAHSLVARARGFRVLSITLFLFGGVTNVDLDSESAKDEFLITIVGPLTSVALGAVFWGIVNTVPLPATWLGAFGYLGWVNLALGLFNLIPAFPLDGGRVLRSILWGATGNMTRATRVASTAGQVFGYVLMGFGLLAIISGNLIGGLWYAGIGWFLAQAARASYAQVHVRRLLATVEAKQVMRPDPDALPASMGVQEAIDQHLLAGTYQSYPVTRNGVVVGILTRGSIRSTASDQRVALRVGDIMTPLADAATVPPTTPMDEVLGLLDKHDTKRVLVADRGEIVGIITPRDVSRWLHNAEELGVLDHNGDG